jgi:hypothetical protein|tara:strand:+ start:343 stop:636 length:294 start_codon:yes stop_codon:yes gene_type:complete
MTKDELNSTTELFQVALNYIFPEFQIKVRTGLIRHMKWEIKKVEQKTLDTYFKNEEGEKTLYPAVITNYYITIRPSQLQKHLIANTWKRVCEKLVVN